MPDTISEEITKEIYEECQKLREKNKYTHNPILDISRKLRPNSEIPDLGDFK